MPAKKTAPAAKPAEVKPEETKPAETKPEAVSFNWDELPEELPQEYTRNLSISTRDVEKETPEPIKARVKAAYEHYVKVYKETEGDDKAKQAKASRDATRVQPCPSEAAAVEFDKLAKRYAKHLGYTCRGAVNPKDKKQYVYRVKPMEVRAKPGKPA